MKELHQCEGCGWLTTNIRFLSFVGHRWLCKHCVSAPKEVHHGN